jgi:hypothetical protein
MPITTGKTTGSSFTGPSTGPFNSKGGGSGVSSTFGIGGIDTSRKTQKTTTAPPPPSVSTTFKQQVFNITCTGMKPNTIHQFFYEGVERGIDCIPVYPKPTGTNVVPGSELKTDSEGKIEFNFYFTLDVEAQVDLANKTQYEVAGDKRFELRATDSSAYKIVPFTKISNDLTANKSSPSDPFSLLSGFLRT